MRMLHTSWYVSREPTDEELRRFDRKRKGKKTSHMERESPTDLDATIVRLTDGRTRLGYKAEHVVDMESGALLAVDVMAATIGDAASIDNRLDLAEKNRNRASDDDDDDDDIGPTGDVRRIKVVVADKGYHQAETLRSLEDKKVRSYIPKRLQHGQRHWAKNGGRATAQSVYRNRARAKRAKGKALQRKRGNSSNAPSPMSARRSNTDEYVFAARRMCESAI